MLDRVISLARSARPISDLSAWRARHDEVTRGVLSPIERAILGGAGMDRLGYVFASGYRSALEALVPGSTKLACLAATEAGGAHPKAIEARLSPTSDGRWRLDGQKEWCTLGPSAEQILVVARTGEDASGRPILKVAIVPRGAQGARFVATAELPFVPEVPHAKLTLDGVIVDTLLPGDGYDDYLKPFRTIEDLHVHAAVLAHVLGLALRGRAPIELVDPTLALLSSATALATYDPRRASTHLALAGLLELGRELVGRATPNPELRDEEAQRWHRDLPLLQVATRPRRARLEAARAALTK